MPDEIKNEGGTQVTPNPAPWGDKFKSPEEVWDAYQKAEEAKAAYAAFGEPKQIEEVINWGRNVAAEIQAGKLRYAEAAKEEPKTTPSSDTAFDLPDNFDELTNREQAYLMTKQLRAAQEQSIKAYVEPLAKQYGEQINNYTAQAEREKALLFRVLEAKLGNPNLNIQDALQQAARLQSSTPDQLLELAIKQAITVPDDKAIEARVSKLVAERLQESENKRAEAIFGINTTHKPRFNTGTKRTRADENRAIMEKMREAGFTS